MSIVTAWITITRIQEVLEELEAMISAKYPEATFAVEVGGEPDGVYLIPTVDLENSLEVLNVIMDRLLEVQIEEQLPVYVVPQRPIGSNYEPARSRKQPADVAATA